MSIIFHESSKMFHLYNGEISYLMCVLPNGHLGNLYFGKRIHDREDFSYLLEMKRRPMSSCVFEGNRKFSLEHLKLEYPVYGSSDYRYPAVEVLQENGSRISDFVYVCFVLSSHLLNRPASEKSFLRVSVSIPSTPRVPSLDALFLRCSLPDICGM